MPRLLYSDTGLKLQEKKAWNNINEERDNAKHKKFICDCQYLQIHLLPHLIFSGCTVLLHGCSFLQFLNVGTKPSLSRIPLALLAKVCQNPRLAHLWFWTMRDIMMKQSPAKENQYIISLCCGPTTSAVIQTRWLCISDIQITKVAYVSWFRASNIKRWNQTVSSHSWYATIHGLCWASFLSFWKVPIHGMRFK